MTSKELAKNLIGLNYYLASYAMWAVNVSHRIKYRDNERYVHTRDHKPERINIGLKNNIVVEAHTG